MIWDLGWQPEPNLNCSATLRMSMGRLRALLSTAALAGRFGPLPPAPCWAAMSAARNWSPRRRRWSRLIVFDEGFARAQVTAAPGDPLSNPCRAGVGCAPCDGRRTFQQADCAAAGISQHTVKFHVNAILVN